MLFGSDISLLAVGLRRTVAVAACLPHLVAQEVTSRLDCGVPFPTSHCLGLGSCGPRPLISISKLVGCGCLSHRRAARARTAPLPPPPPLSRCCQQSREPRDREASKKEAKGKRAIYICGTPAPGACPPPAAW